MDSTAGLKIKEFAGPLDLLLQEVSRQKVAIEHLALAPIVSRFLSYIETASACNINLDMEWLHMAATLIEWKSRSLLPADPATPPAGDLVREELVQELLAHSRRAAEELAERRAIEEARFSRPGMDEFRDPPTAAPEPSFVSVWDLIQQARELAAWVQEYRAGRRRVAEQALRVEPDEATIAEMSEFLQAQLLRAEGGKLNGFEVLQNQASVSRRSSLFLGMLEMVRDHKIQVEQNEGFGPIWLTIGTAVAQS